MHSFTPRWLLSYALLLAAVLIVCCSDDNGESCTSAACLADAAADSVHLDQGLQPDTQGQLDGQVQPDSQVQLDGQVQPDSQTEADSGVPYVHEDISVQQLDQWIKAGKVMTMVDVREGFEYQAGHIANAINKPWNSQVLQADYSQLPGNTPIVVICQSGNRSDQAAQFLTGKGFQPVYDMLGGMSAWIAAGFPVVQ
jgi:rhodanese-related sulfurtransferase